MTIQHLKRRSLNALLGAALAGAMFALAGPAAAATAGSLEAATYAGADRQQHLVSAARKEGELMIYTSVPVDDMAVLTAAFEKKYGIKVKVWRAGSEKVLPVSYTHLRAHETDSYLVCRLLLEK